MDGTYHESPNGCAGRPTFATNRDSTDKKKSWNSRWDFGMACGYRDRSARKVGLAKRLHFWGRRTGATILAWPPFPLGVVRACFAGKRSLLRTRVVGLRLTARSTAPARRDMPALIVRLGQTNKKAKSAIRRRPSGSADAWIEIQPGRRWLRTESRSLLQTGRARQR